MSRSLKQLETIFLGASFPVTLIERELIEKVRDNVMNVIGGLTQEEFDLIKVDYP